MIPIEVLKKVNVCAGCPESVVGNTIQCRVANKTVEFGADFCPLGKWEQAFQMGATRIRYDQDANVVWIAKPDKQVEDMLDAEHERIPGTLKWKADKGWSKKVASAIEAIYSGRYPNDHPIVQQRKLSCFGDPAQGIQACDALKRDTDGNYCMACGCGKTLLSNLDGSIAKLNYKTLKCPKFMPGFSNAQK